MNTAFECRKNVAGQGTLEKRVVDVIKKNWVKKINIMPEDASLWLEAEKWWIYWCIFEVSDKKMFAWGRQRKHGFCQVSYCFRYHVSHYNYSLNKSSRLTSLTTDFHGHLYLANRFAICVLYFNPCRHFARIKTNCCCPVNDTRTLWERRTK